MLIYLDYCHDYIKNPRLKLPRLVLTAHKKEIPDPIYIGTLNAQGFTTEERPTIYAEDFQSLGLSIVGITEVKKRNDDWSVLNTWAAVNNFKLFATKHVAIISFNSRFTWYEEPVTDFEGRKATAKLYFNRAVPL
ncbi:hypothetical protein DSO57_1037466 [Entomophthora muscae]|uniref:Uncharacterized protein n=1 Tax=Entomophthora muscae TaxID=34485 RepID=A0ACC2RPX9_9FUNG|nr:hypothetical protein DSO57_1037466 [Entomophthora muscae]